MSRKHHRGRRGHAFKNHVPAKHDHNDASNSNSQSQSNSQSESNDD